MRILVQNSYRLLPKVVGNPLHLLHQVQLLQASGEHPACLFGQLETFSFSFPPQQTRKSSKIGSECAEQARKTARRSSCCDNETGAENLARKMRLMTFRQPQLLSELLLSSGSYFEPSQYKINKPSCYFFIRYAK